MSKQELKKVFFCLYVKEGTRSVLICEGGHEGVF